MAIYHLHVKSISRGDGRSAPGAAAYRAGERIRDERTGLLHNHSRRRDVTHKEIVLPTALSGTDMAWARNRESLWNTVERAEGRRNARLAREYEVALPAELSAPQRLQLARAFSQELADRHSVAVDLAIHDPRPTSDPRHYHAHLLATTREVSAAGLGAKAGLDMSSEARQRRGLLPNIVEFNAVRERWGALVNEALHAAGLSARVDHRSLQARGIDQEPRPHIPYAALQSERHGLRSEIAEQLRERYRLRVQERERQAQHSPAALQPDQSALSAPVAESLEQVRRQARDAWLKLRREQSATLSAPERGLEADLADKDLSL